MIVTVTWLNGHSTVGRDWQHTEQMMRESQWTPPADKDDWRDEMRKRCKVWTGAPVDALRWMSSQHFIRTLEASGLCRVDVEKGYVIQSSKTHREGNTR